LAGLLCAFSGLLEIETTDDQLKHGVELALGVVGLERAGIYLYDEPADLMLGTWGTALDGQVIDEHHAMFSLGEDGRRVFERAASGEAFWSVIDRCPLIDQRDRTTTVVGVGWVVCTPIRVGSKWLGMLYNDSGTTGAPVEPARQGQAAALCSMIGAALSAKRHSNQFSSLPSATARHPVLRKAVHRLARDPSLGGTPLAQELGISASRLARLFKVEMGVSLVDYRNQLRLERFFELIENSDGNMMRAALGAGFGSYAQFHRVFRTLRSTTPREYLAERGIRLCRRDLT
jgi:AraC-like DNA-binding protein